MADDVNLFSPAFRHDRTAYLSDLLRRRPVAYSELGAYYIVSKHADIAECCQSPEVWRGAGGGGLTRESPAHDALIRLVRAVVTPAYVAALEDGVRAFAAERVAGFADRGHVDLHASYSATLPLFVVCGMLGLPYEGRAGAYRRWAMDCAAAVLCDPDDLTTLGRAAAARAEMREVFTPVIEDWSRRVAAGEAPADANLITRLAAAELDGARPTTARILAFCKFLLVAGSAASTALISNLVLRLLQEPAQFDRLEADPSLLPNAIEESLRLDAPVHGLFRTATRAIELRGVEIPAGSKVMMACAGGNLDPEFVDNPTVFDIGRDPALLRRQLAFGHGAHACLGAALARMEARIALEELLRAIPHPRLMSRPPRDDVSVLNTPASLWIAWDEP